MTLARLDGVSYWYPRSEAPALAEVSFEVSEGEFSLVAGPSAGGKSTLLRLFNGLVPQFHGGRLAGRVEVAGFEPARTPARQMALIAGMVFQEPEAQAVAETVEEEVAFGMEQQGLARGEMVRRMDQVLGILRIEHLRHRRLITLSGGERQRVAIASVLALEPRLLVLDEAASQLDPDGAEALIAALVSLHRRGDVAMLLAEHRLDRLLPVVDRVIGVGGGQAQVMSPTEAADRLASVPPVCQLARRLGIEPAPLTVEEARQALPTGLRPKQRATGTPGDVLLRAEALTVAYGEHVALRSAGFELCEGEIVALVGANGGGKTTLFRALTGLTKPASGSVSYPGARGAMTSVREVTSFAGLVPQDPALALYHESVRDELTESLANRSGRKPSREVLGACEERWGIGHLAGRNPRDVSVGQQQRVALAAMLAHEPRVWLLDEPTRGADGESKAWLAERLRAHGRAGGAAIVATHDMEAAAHYATRVIELDCGEVVFDGPARAAFGHEGRRPTQVARLVPGALTVEEVECG
jgi:energy-coupling factor transporter ATP-binding protein EcfA2